MKKPLVAIIIPTFDNPGYLVPCIDSIYRYTDRDLFKIYVVNNGSAEHMRYIADYPGIEVIQMKKNAGWEGGIKIGTDVSTEPFILFLNDDTVIPGHQRDWLKKLLAHFAFDECAAAGPTSNVVMGKQQYLLPFNEKTVDAKFLIGFCMLVRRSALLAAGGVDMTLPGGDDLDLSIRLRKLQKTLVIDRDVFICHHGFKTGERVEGGPHEGGWNSLQKIEKTNFALINKHGLRWFLDLWTEGDNYVKNLKTEIKLEVVGANGLH